jgi:hypothetical protein
MYQYTYLKVDNLRRRDGQQRKKNDRGEGETDSHGWFRYYMVSDINALVASFRVSLLDPVQLTMNEWTVEWTVAVAGVWKDRRLVSSARQMTDPVAFCRYNYNGVSRP